MAQASGARMKLRSAFAGLILGQRFSSLAGRSACREAKRDIIHRGVDPLDYKFVDRLDQARLFGLNQAYSSSVD
jgi:hypothetical protein